MDNEIQTQQETSLEAAPAQDTNTSTTTTGTTTEGKPQEATTKSEGWEYNGDRKAVPSEFRKYVEGLDRYVSKRDQSRAELEKKAKEYESFVTSDAYKSYQQFVKNPQQTNTGSQSQPEAPQVTQEEAEAIMLGDAKTLQKVIQREAQRTLEASVNPKEQALNQKLTAIETRQKEIDSAEMIKAFADVNPDFWELYDTYEDYCVTAARNGKSLEDIYKSVKFFEDKVSQRMETKKQADLKLKKDGSVVGKSVAGTSDTIYADDENHAKRLAIELALKGDTRQVQVKRNKK